MLRNHCLQHSLCSQSKEKIQKPEKYMKYYSRIWQNSFRSRWNWQVLSHRFWLAVYIINLKTTNPSVGPKQFCAFAHQGYICKAGTSYLVIHNCKWWWKKTAQMVSRIKLRYCTFLTAKELARCPRKYIALHDSFIFYYFITYTAWIFWKRS